MICFIKKVIPKICHWLLTSIPFTGDFQLRQALHQVEPTPDFYEEFVFTIFLFKAKKNSFVFMSLLSISFKFR